VSSATTASGSSASPTWSSRTTARCERSSNDSWSRSKASGSTGSHPASRRALGLWTAATLLAVLPACLGPTDRALFGGTFGAAAVEGWAVASCIDVVRRRLVRGWLLRTVAAVAALVLVVVRGAISAVITFDAARAAKDVSAAQRRGIAALPLTSPGATDVVVLLADDQTMGPWGDVVHSFRSGRRARSWQALSLTSGPHHLTRVDARTFDLEAASPDGFSTRIYRNTERHPLRVGQRFETPELSVEVTATAGGRATRIRVHAARPLDDPGWCFATRSATGAVSANTGEARTKTNPQIRFRMRKR